MSQNRNIFKQELLICGDFNQGYEKDNILNEMFSHLNLEHFGKNPTCALSTKTYDMFDRIYMLKKQNYKFQTICEANKLLKHDYFENEDENVGDFYSDHAMLILDISTNNVDTNNINEIIIQ